MCGFVWVRVMVMVMCRVAMYWARVDGIDGVVTRESDGSDLTGVWTTAKCVQYIHVSFDAHSKFCVGRKAGGSYERNSSHTRQGLRLYMHAVLHIELVPITDLRCALIITYLPRWVSILCRLRSQPIARFKSPHSLTVLPLHWANWISITCRFYHPGIDSSGITRVICIASMSIEETKEVCCSLHWLKDH